MIEPYKMKPEPPNELKNFDDIKIGDKLVIEVPTVFFYVGEVTFINRDLKFVFLDEDPDDEDEYNIPFIPDKNGCFKVLK